MRGWFIQRWFVGTYLIIAGIWIVTTIAYVAGAERITFGNPYGEPATIDFMREHDHVVLRLADGLGLEINDRGPSLSGDVVVLERGLPLIHPICGYHDRVDGIGIVDYRDGDWFFGKPRDHSTNHEARHGRDVSRAFILTIAYNRATNQRVQIDVDDSVAEQQRKLTALGLTPGPDTALSVEGLGDLRLVSMQREGCVIYNAAFVAVAVLWLVIGGAALGIGQLRRVKP